MTNNSSSSSPNKNSPKPNSTLTSTLNSARNLSEANSSEAPLTKVNSSVKSSDLNPSSTRKKIAIFPASFDPITLGHLDIIKRASVLCDELIVIVANNLSKKYLLSLEQRKTLVAKALKEAQLSNVRVIDSVDLLAKEYIKHNALCIVRGVRNYQDFEYEVNLASINADLASRLSASEVALETIYLVASSNLKHISSSLIRELASQEQWFADFAVHYVPQAIVGDLTKIILHRHD